MNWNVALLLILAVVCANIPWISQRFLLFITPVKGKKEWMRLIEWLLFYAIIGLIAIGLEQKTLGTLHQQQWEFYVTTLCLFMVCAFPGFIYRHQLIHQLQRK